MENWERWEEEKPAWYTDEWKASVENDIKQDRSASTSLRMTSVTPVAGGEGRGFWSRR
jgi:hypothetical protein